MQHLKRRLKSVITVNSKIAATEADGYRVVGYCHIDVEGELKPYSRDVLKGELLAIFKVLNKIDPDIVTDAMGEFVMMLMEVAEHDKDNRS